MKKVVFSLILLLSVSLFADDITLWEKSTLNKILQRGEIQVCTEPGYLPFEMKDKKGDIIGYGRENG